ncbi:hypothetical protein [Moheibacter sediminis]|uniref:Lipocalin-like domain-containing protein n=1 Tax=Moheibacter sediminis TaxID=1434700 RepID=A0A1W1Z1I0_9FLAO|nr:hypothetical protein [Moheibacter sediminis]SMC41808.1 hypothetical protein SAMN06296427_10269 [Moheibacter sediminis]
MKSLIITFLFISSISFAQTFPQSHEGIWKGELNIYTAQSDQPVQTLEMQLKIFPIDDKTWSWEIGYLIGDGDIRKYELKPVNSEKNEWQIDEKNGIVLFQMLLGNRLVGSFSIENSLIINSYEFNQDNILVEFYSTQLKSEDKTGKGTEDSPFVLNHKVGNYQKAVLKKQ